MRKSKEKVWVFEVLYTDGFKEKIVTRFLDDLGMIIFGSWQDIASIKEIKEVKK